MIKILMVFLILFTFIWAFVELLPLIPRELWYNYIKKVLVILGVLVVTSGIMFIFVQLF